MVAAVIVIAAGLGVWAAISVWILAATMWVLLVSLVVFIRPRSGLEIREL